MRILETIIQWSHCNAGEEGSSKGADPSRLRGGVGGVGIFMQDKDAVGDYTIPPSGSTAGAGKMHSFFQQTQNKMAGGDEHTELQCSTLVRAVCCPLVWQSLTTSS